MPVISSKKDPANLTLEFVTQLDDAGASGAREDPRQLEKWWGPSAYPATFVRHDFEVGGESGTS